jgi:hypothetical protein
VRIRPDLITGVRLTASDSADGSDASEMSDASDGA